MCKKDYKKYENVILYLCNKLGGSVKGIKKLYKLLYYVDFDRFEYKESFKSVTGTKYIALPMGPVPEKKVFDFVIDKMIKNGKLSKEENIVGNGYRPVVVFISQEEPDMSVFDSDDIFILKRVIGKYGKLNGNELEALTHKEAPWLSASVEDRDEILFETAFYRGTDFGEI